MPLPTIGIGIYTSADPDKRLSQSGAFTNPLLVTLDGRKGQTLQQKLYVRNDNSLYSYSGISLTPTYNAGINVIDGSQGYSWKLYAIDQQPTEDQWSVVQAGNSIAFSGVLGTVTVPDISTYLPFWTRVTAPKNVPVQTITDVTLKISATEILL
jgi:hypothetical protein